MLSLLNLMFRHAPHALALLLGACATPLWAANPIVVDRRPGALEVLIPSEPSAGRGGRSNPTLAGPERRVVVDANTASAEALQAVTGIGPAMAQKIVAARKKAGPFTSAEDLADRVAGIGPKTVERLQEAGLELP